MSDYDFKKCHKKCSKDQTSEHLLTACQYFKEDQSELKSQIRKINLSYTIKTLFIIKKEIKVTLRFLKKTKVTTKK